MCATRSSWAGSEIRRQEIAELGEFGLISEIKKWCQTAPPQGLLKGIGDDAALLSPKAGHELLFCTDMLVEGIHFDLRYAPLQHVGYKALVVNISDILAMNARPRYALISLGVSNRFSVEDIRTLYEGIQRACAHYKVAVVGGDTVSTRSGLTLSVAMLGEGVSGRAVARGGAQIDDYVCVTGDLGAAYVGFRALAQGQQTFLKEQKQPDLSADSYVVGRYLKPEARRDLIFLLAERHILPTAMIDVSDGFCADLQHICQDSKVGVRIETHKLPIASDTQASAQRFSIDPVEAACYGGEDYELLFTLSAADYEKIKDCTDISYLGRIQAAEKGSYVYDAQGQKKPLAAKGWDHFSASKK